MQAQTNNTRKRMLTTKRRRGRRALKDKKLAQDKYTQPAERFANTSHHNLLSSDKMQDTELESK